MTLKVLLGTKMERMMPTNAIMPSGLMTKIHIDQAINDVRGVVAETGVADQLVVTSEGLAVAATNIDSLIVGTGKDHVAAARIGNTATVTKKAVVGAVAAEVMNPFVNVLS